MIDYRGRTNDGQIMMDEEEYKQLQARVKDLEAINLGLTKTLVEMEAEKAKLVGALEEIIHPVRFMQERLGEGERLNGMAAVQLAEDASYLRGIALAAYRKQGGE